ncbi:type II secretion system protein GspM [Oceanimonas doudoroffii]|uniref:General secretion pathway protein GspM n=1 Tax=Oceanimonas doudoroffii TaxID=84158 RepID=A0A233RB15_9GAMM|nr:type II secretion system protein GspM [Oceanimonas doudoroffii]OXY80589.1 general secretion pathway protein GspM [Oceanimonas doudoroffii]
MSPNARQQQLAALGLLLLVMVLLTSLVISPLIGLFFHQGEQLDQLASRLERYRALAEQRDETDRQLQHIRARQPDNDLYLPEQRPTLAQAWLQQHLNLLVAQHGGQLISIQNASANANAPLPEVMLRVHLRSELDELVPLLHALESNTPVLFISELVISASSRENRRTAPLNRRQQPERPTLDVRFNLLGYTPQGAS